MCLCERVLSDLCIETEAGGRQWGCRSGENENTQGHSGVSLGRRGKHLSQTHFSYITLFPRIHLAYIWKSYTCLKCYSKEQFVALKYFMWELGEKDNTQHEKVFEFNLSAKENTVYAFFPQESWSLRHFFPAFWLFHFTLPMFCHLF